MAIVKIKIAENRHQPLQALRLLQACSRCSLRHSGADALHFNSITLRQKAFFPAGERLYLQQLIKFVQP